MVAPNPGIGLVAGKRSAAKARVTAGSAARRKIKREFIMYD